MRGETRRGTTRETGLSPANRYVRPLALLDLATFDASQRIRRGPEILSEAVLHQGQIPGRTRDHEEARPAAQSDQKAHQGAATIEYFKVRGLRSSRLDSRVVAQPGAKPPFDRKRPRPSQALGRSGGSKKANGCLRLGRGLVPGLPAASSRKTRRNSPETSPNIPSAPPVRCRHRRCRQHVSGRD